MFRFVYAWRSGETFDTWATDGFEGVETADASPDGALPDGVSRIGRNDGSAAAGTKYVVVPVEPISPARFGVHLRDAAARLSPTLLLVPNVGPYATASALWTVLEAAHHPSVRVALDLAAAQAAGQSAAVLVPTLNLRIGLVRATVPQADLADYARRLAGIGFDGYVVCDPPSEPDRPAAARELAGIFRAVFPVKSEKKAVPANRFAAK